MIHAMTNGLRGALLAISVLVAAWFGIGVLQARDTAHATQNLSSGGRLSQARAHQTASELRDAGFLNPDRQVEILRGQLYLNQGNEPAARSLLIRLVKAEPDNLNAWIWLARASVHDLKWFYSAAFRIRQLVPPVPAAR
jgi:hypothetical protein